MVIAKSPSITLRVSGCDCHFGESGITLFRKELTMSRLALCEISGPLTDLIQKLSGESGDLWAEHLKKMLREGVRCWREQDGVIYFSVMSNGMTGSQWIEHFEKKGIQLSVWAKDILNSPDFKWTNGVTTEVAVLKGTLFTESDRVTSKIRAYANKFNLDKPNCKLIKPEAELGCLICDMLTDEEIKAMGLVWIIAFHEPIMDSGGAPHLLGADCGDDGHWLSAYYGEPDDRWDRDSGFAFAVSQVSS